LPVAKEEAGYGIGLQILINAGQQIVWDAITNPKKLTIWDYPDQSSMDLRVKGWIRLRSGGIEREGRIILLNPPAALPIGFLHPIRHPSATGYLLPQFTINWTICLVRLGSDCAIRAFPKSNSLRSKNAPGRGYTCRD